MGRSGEAHVSVGWGAFSWRRQLVSSPALWLLLSWTGLGACEMAVFQDWLPSIHQRLGKEKHKPRRMGHHLKASSFPLALLWWVGSLGVRHRLCYRRAWAKSEAQPRMSGHLLMKGPLAFGIQPGSGVLLSRLSSVRLTDSFWISLSFPILKVMALLPYQNV